MKSVSHPPILAGDNLPYRADGGTLPCTTRAAHPLITEDTGTQGAGRWQLEATLDHHRGHAPGLLTVSDERKLVLSYGLKDPLDLIVTVPHTRTRTDDTPAVQGRGDVEFAAK